MSEKHIVLVAKCNSGKRCKSLTKKCVAKCKNITVSCEKVVFAKKNLIDNIVLGSFENWAHLFMTLETLSYIWKMFSFEFLHAAL